MPTIQSTYNARHGRWYEGMVLNQEPADIITRTVEDVEGTAVRLVHPVDGGAVDRAPPAVELVEQALAAGETIGADGLLPEERQVLAVHAGGGESVSRSML